MSSFGTGIIIIRSREKFFVENSFICGDYFKINKINTAPYNAKCNGLTERFNKTLCDILSVYCASNQVNWDLYLPLMLYAYRTSEQATTRDTPFGSLYGREARLNEIDNFNYGYEPSEFIKNMHFRWQEAKRCIEKAAERNKRIYDSRNKDPVEVYKVNDYVRVKQPLTEIGLKKKLRGDLWSEPQMWKFNYQTEKLK